MEHEARASNVRSRLTRRVGYEAVVRCDFKRVKLMSRDRILLCTDGLYCFVNDGEISEGVDRLNMDEVCPYLISLAERRATDDNLSAPVVQIFPLVDPNTDSPISLIKNYTTH